MNNKLTSPNLFSDVCGIIEQGRQQAYAAVNKSMIETYWNIGKRIVEEEQSGKERAEYGEEIINNLSTQLTHAMVKALVQGTFVPFVGFIFLLMTMRFGNRDFQISLEHIFSRSYA